MVHVVAQCHEEGLEHYLRSYVKVPTFSPATCENAEGTQAIPLMQFFLPLCL